MLTHKTFLTGGCNVGDPVHDGYYRVAGSAFGRSPVSKDFQLVIGAGAGSDDLQGLLDLSQSSSVASTAT
jgi:hypothetical protein